MRTPSPSSRGRHRDLDALAATLADEAATSSDALIVGIVEPVAPTAPGQLEVLPLAGEHPLVTLLGFTAPARWQAIAVTASGTAFPIDDPGGSRRPVQICHLLHRSGETVSVLRDDDGLQHPPHPPEGAIPDACRRALGLPTAPPPASTGILWAVVWLDRMVEAAGEPVDRSRFASFDGVAELHPAAVPGQPAEALPDAAARFTAEHPWSRLRAEPHLLPWPVAHEVTPEVAAWMDDGMLARWALTAYPDVFDLARSLSPLVDVDVGLRVAEVLGAGMLRR